MIKPTLSILALLTVLSIPSLALAQSPIEAGAWTFSPLLGVAFDPDADASLALAGAVDYHITPVFALEGELGHIFDTAPDVAELDASLTTAHASVLYIFDSEYAIRPYLAAGIGGGHYSVEVRTPRASLERTEVGFDLGAGVIYPLDDRLGVRGDFRYFKHIDDVPSAWRFSGGVTLRLAP
jgi:opacity protein-like surface antigen